METPLLRLQSWKSDGFQQLFDFDLKFSELLVPAQLDILKNMADNPPKQLQREDTYAFLLPQKVQTQSLDEINFESLGAKPVEEVQVLPSSRSKRKREVCDQDTREAKRKESSWKVWTKTEEVFLIGAVFELLFERGSLTASNLRSDVWETVKEKYDEAWEKYQDYVAIKERRSATSSSNRSSRALYRHYKVLKERVAGNSTNAPPPGTKKFSFLRYYEAWKVVKNTLFGFTEQTSCQDIIEDIL